MGPSHPHKMLSYDLPCSFPSVRSLLASALDPCFGALSSSSSSNGVRPGLGQPLALISLAPVWIARAEASCRLARTFCAAGHTSTAATQRTPCGLNEGTRLGGCYWAAGSRVAQSSTAAGIGGERGPAGTGGPGTPGDGRGRAGTGGNRGGRALGANLTKGPVFSSVRRI